MRTTESLAAPEPSRAHDPGARRPRVLLTRATDRVDALARGCIALGLEPVSLACLEIEALPPPPAGDAFPRGTLVFTSVPAVHGAVRRRPPPWPGVRTLAIGAATRDALVAAGCPPCAEPVPPYTSEALLARLLSTDAPLVPALAGGVTIVKGVGGRDALERGLNGAGVPVATLELYRRVRPAHPAATIDAALAPLPDIACTTSDEVLDNLLALAGARAPALRRVPLVVNGERAAAHARARGFAVEVLVASPPGDAGQLERLERWARDRTAGSRPGPRTAARP